MGWTIFVQLGLAVASRRRPRLSGSVTVRAGSLLPSSPLASGFAKRADLGEAVAFKKGDGDVVQEAGLGGGLADLAE